MKPALMLVATIAVGLFAGYVGGMVAPHGSAAAHKETAFERVMRTKTIRCGYGAWPPMVLTIDPGTKKISGFAAEIIEIIAAKHNLKVDWAEEAGWSSYPEGLNSGRFDVFCSSAWIKAELGSHVFYSLPFAYSSLHFYVRADDHRFDEDFSKLNDPAYSLSVMDGEISQIYASLHYPKARQVAIPQIGDITQIFLNVGTGKADGVFNDPSLARDYATKNPGKIRQVTKEPLAVYGNAYPVGFGEVELQNMLNAALAEMINFGEIDRITAKYDPGHTAFLPVVKPYSYVPSQALP